MGYGGNGNGNGNGGGDKNNHLHLNFHLNLSQMLNHHHRNQIQHNRNQKLQIHHHVPKGFVAVMVGLGEEKQQRFLVPVTNVNHPLFMELLKEAEEEYGFDHEGVINIPCNVEEFRRVEGMIDREKSHHHHHHHHNHHHHHTWCFKA